MGANSHHRGVLEVEIEGSMLSLMWAEIPIFSIAC